MTTPTPDDLKRAEVIVHKICGFGYIGYQRDIKTIEQALSEERARTLNSEAVQGLVQALEKISSFRCDVSALGVKCPGCIVCIAKEAFEKFQQFKDGK